MRQLLQHHGLEKKADKTYKVAPNTGHHVNIVLVIVYANFASNPMDRGLSADDLRCRWKLLLGIAFLNSLPTSDCTDIVLVSDKGGRKRLASNKR